MKQLIVLAFVFCAAFHATAQQVGNASADALSQQADAAYDAQDWVKAADLYEQLSKQAPGAARIWLRLGAALRSTGKYDAALASFEKAVQNGAAVQGEYGKAATFAAMNQPDQALASLENALKQGYATPDALAGDSKFAMLHSLPAFAKLVEQAKRNQRPCAFTQENRQFDFWIGEWNVTATQGGAPAGNSKIELILDDCVVQENWSSLNSPYTGKSYNIYNAALKRWEQYWVDSVGGNIFFHGGLKNGVMDYWSDETPQPNGTKLERHLQFFALGKDAVRQFSQGSTDGGKTWHVEYDLTYTRKHAD
jgi:tetratricopeptide (TPR) repeat protein